MNKPTRHIPLEDCEDRYIYRLKSRNLKFGVFVERTKGFIGIREKFGNEFLFTEYHHDADPHLGTARPIERIREITNENIRMYEMHPVSTCRFCGDLVRSVNLGTEQDKQYHWFHVTGDQSCKKVSPQGHMNEPLFDALKSIEGEDRCPLCGSDNIANEGPSEDGQLFVTCHDCSHQWTEPA